MMKNLLAHKQVYSAILATETMPTWVPLVTEMTRDLPLVRPKKYSIRLLASLWLFLLKERNGKGKHTYHRYPSSYLPSSRLHLKLSWVQGRDVVGRNEAKGNQKTRDLGYSKKKNGRPAGMIQWLSVDP